MPKLRILLLLNGRFPTEKAYGIQTITMAEGYAAAGHEVAIAYPRRTDEKPMPIPGVAFLPFGSQLNLLRPWMFPFLRFLGAYQAMDTIRKFRPDVVIANDPLQTAILSKSFPVVWELHDLPDLRRLGRRILVKIILRNVRGVVSTNLLKLEELKKLGIKNLPHYVVVPNAVAFDPFVYREIDRVDARKRLGISLDETSIVYTGQLFDWKGVDTLIESIVESGRSQSPDNVIHVIGGLGPDLERLKKLKEKIWKQGWADVVFHGQRPKEEIPYWLRAATVVVIPNSGKFDISSRDTSPLKLFEALASGAAIIASNLPSIREVVGSSEAVIFFRADDPSYLAKAISDVVGDKERLERMRKAAENFPVLTGETRALRIVGFLNSILPQIAPR